MAISDVALSEEPWYTPFVTYPSRLHGTRIPPKCQLTNEQCAFKSSRWLDWYNADRVYGLPAVYLFLSVISVFIVIHLLARFTPRSIANHPASRRIISVIRYLTYKSWRIYGTTTPPLGFLLLIAVGIIFFAIMSLGPKPYYWPTDANYGNAPPLASRTGWLTLACLPFVLILGAKANLVTAVTGVSHEKLTVWHIWVSWAMFVLALMHAFPAIVRRAWEGQTHAGFTTGGVFMTGVIALLAQAWMTFMSISWIRNRFYEFFKANHMFFAIVFITFYFLHCTLVLTSWDYFIAAVGLYFACLGFALLKTFVAHGIHRKAIVRLETPHTMRIAIPTDASWQPGQHVYLRFLSSMGVDAFTSHPFTICSLPTTRNREMVFFVKPRAGITRRLATLADKTPNKSISILLDGPYGGLPTRWSTGFDHTLIVAGGSGCGFALSLIQDWVQTRKLDSSSTKELHVLLVTRDQEMRYWYIEELQRMVYDHSAGSLCDIHGLSIRIFQTGESHFASMKDSFSESDSEKSPVTYEFSRETGLVTSMGVVKCSTGRPYISGLVRHFTLQVNATVGIAVCGPSSMIHDVSAVAASAQAKIAAGDNDVAAEVWLHRETFS